MNTNGQIAHDRTVGGVRITEFIDGTVRYIDANGKVTINQYTKG